MNAKIKRAIEPQKEGQKPKYEYDPLFGQPCFKAIGRQPYNFEFSISKFKKKYITKIYQIYCLKCIIFVNNTYQICLILNIKLLK